MSWDDWVGGILTGGLYNLGKSIYNASESAGEAAEEAGEAAEQAGIAIAVIGSTIEAVGKQLKSLLEEIEELVTINRLTPRDESDLWEEEKERLDDLRAEKARIESKLAELGVTDTGGFTFDFTEFFTDLENMIKKLQLVSRLVVVNKEIHEILYQEPGVVTTAIYNANEVLERFNTIEQPMIEDILDSVDDNLEVTEETITQIKKLFVTKKKVTVPALELSDELKGKLKFYEENIKYYKGLIDKKSVISNQLMGALEKIPDRKFEISEKGIRIAGIRRASPNVASDITKANNEKTAPVEKDETGGTRKTIASDLNKNPAEFRVNIPSKEAEKKIDMGTIGRLNLALARTPGISKAAIQPQGFKVSSVMNTKFDGYQRKFDFSRAQLAFYDRELLKNARKIDKIKYRWVEEPGVIPKTLDEIKEILERVRTEEQPRVEKVLDTLNGNLEESKEMLSKINDSLDSSKGMFTFFDKYGTMIKYGAAVFGVVVFLDILVGLIVLIRMALGM